MSVASWDLAAPSAAFAWAVPRLFWAIVSFREVLAVDSWSLAWLIESLAEAIVAAVGPALSRARRAWAAVRFAWATWSCTFRVESSIVARTWPVVTLSPTATFTAVTVPEVAKLSSSTVDEATEPETLTL